MAISRNLFHASTKHLLHVGSSSAQTNGRSTRNVRRQTHFYKAKCQIAPKSIDLDEQRSNDKNALLKIARALPKKCLKPTRGANFPNCVFRNSIQDPIFKKHITYSPNYGISKAIFRSILLLFFENKDFLFFPLFFN